MLCFIQHKGDIIAVDDIYKICAEFYSAEDVEKAHSVLLRYVNQKRLPKQKGSGKDVVLCSVAMVVKICLDPSVKLPTFCAVNLSRLPPVDAEHVDISAILSELSALRCEVKFELFHSYTVKLSNYAHQWHMSDQTLNFHHCRLLQQVHLLLLATVVVMVTAVVKRCWKM